MCTLLAYVITVQYISNLQIGSWSSWSSFKTEFVMETSWFVLGEIWVVPLNSEKKLGAPKIRWRNHKKWFSQCLWS